MELTDRMRLQDERRQHHGWHAQYTDKVRAEAGEAWEVLDRYGRRWGTGSCPAAAWRNAMAWADIEQSMSWLDEERRRADA